MLTPDQEKLIRLGRFSAACSILIKESSYLSEAYPEIRVVLTTLANTVSNTRLDIGERLNLN